MELNLVWSGHFLVCPGIAVLVPGIEGEPREHCTDEDDPESQQIDIERPEDVETNQQMTLVISVPKRKLVTEAEETFMIIFNTCMLSFAYRKCYLFYPGLTFYLRRQLTCLEILRTGEAFPEFHGHYYLYNGI